ncbi:MAG: hypothetical protein QOJ27_711 [Sphingomonadales bacterium]|nr:hypothetical protein [Sphingomonadales bacterium]
MAVFVTQFRGEQWVDVSHRRLTPFGCRTRGCNAFRRTATALDGMNDPMTPMIATAKPTEQSVLLYKLDNVSRFIGVHRQRPLIECAQVFMTERLEPFLGPGLLHAASLCRTVLNSIFLS